ncbi:secreted salivary gland peptide, putative [Ixodes scapularis]|uniref:Secreted salivary gland peptide, putative n=1 Tax=Ixodes scapularis TaxID=6945 RepID=B7Q4Y5_IXOSC|nr:secreted salivary gland peptide, putative [Ixodes scapularis]|eukprot:XP_002411644.1 secreted salivary gland peptide, putative [Ixodes scapularis]
MGIRTTLLYALVAFSLMWKISQALGLLKIVNGKCKYGNHLIADGASLNLENPCQTFYCNAQLGTISSLGCALMPNPSNCRVYKGTGPYPKCCNQINCTGTPQFQVA